MQWKNTETPTFAGSDGTSITGPDVVETLDLLDRDGNALATFSKAVDGSSSLQLEGGLNVVGNLEAPIVGNTDPYSDSHSYQPVGPDLTIAATAGSNDGTNPKFLAAVMGNLIGDTPTNDSNYLGGVIGANSLDCSASDYPTFGVLGLLFDGAQVDSIVMAVVDGDDNSGNQTNARAAFGVAVNNNVAGSGCEYGLSLYAAPNTNYGGTPLGFVPSKADLEFSNQQRLVALTTAITANSTTTDAPAGSIGITSHATGRGKLFTSDGSKWQFAVVA
jgi:hypothetical protein